jgi:hypothetical protein
MSALRLTWDNFSVAIQVEIASARIAESDCPLWGARDGTVSEDLRMMSPSFFTKETGLFLTTLC